MKRANIKAYNQEYKNFILIENMSDMIDFRHEVTYGMMKESARSLVDRKMGKDDKHSTDAITYSVEKLNERKNQGALFLQSKIMGEMMNAQDEYIIKGDKIVVNPFNMVSYFTLPVDAEIEIISKREKYTLDDIKVSRWPEGCHWYAKVGLIDVVVDGECKWNAKWVAQKKAEEFLNNL